MGNSDGNTGFGADKAQLAFNSQDDFFLVVWQGDDETGSLVMDEIEIFGQGFAAEIFDVYVDADAVGGATGLSWTDAYTSLQDGLAVAYTDTRILVAEGIYYPDEGTGQVNDWISSTFVLTDGVAIYGGFDPGDGIDTWEGRDWRTQVTVLSGDLAQDDATDAAGVTTTTTNIFGSNAYHVVSGSGVDGTALLDGFAITAGQANGIGPQIYGGGMYNTSGSSPTLTNLAFRGNLADHNGGGIHNENGSSPTLTNVIFTGNQAVSNRGGAVSNMYDSNPTFSNVFIADNTAGNRGGAMFVRESHPVLINVTIAGNSAGIAAGGIYNWDNSTLTITNSILWGNTHPGGYSQINNNDGSSAVVNFSDIQGGYAGTNNIDADPLFVSEFDDLHQRQKSPVIDAGTNTGCPATDLDGITRPIGGVCDMGAYEVEGLSLIFLPLILK